jgi:hypothetical protein
VNHFEALEAGLAAPLAEVRAGKVERVAELDQHVQRHQQAEKILAPPVADQGFNRHQRSAGRQRFECRPDQVHLFLQVPVMQDHAHRDDVGLWQWVGAQFRALHTPAAESGEYGELHGGEKHLRRPEGEGRL